jgi:hypothetical protein
MVREGATVVTISGGHKSNHEVVVSTIYHSLHRCLKFFDNDIPCSVSCGSKIGSVDHGGEHVLAIPSTCPMPALAQLIRIGFHLNSRRILGTSVLLP